ncbi:MAG: hypothetical protein ACYSUI_11460, partial [Planctomycetota bacterium]
MFRYRKASIVTMAAGAVLGLGAYALVTGSSHELLDRPGHLERRAAATAARTVAGGSAFGTLRPELPDDEPAQRVLPSGVPPTSPAARVTRGSYESIQVNVNAAGFNIVGDAANEPSIAIDPTDPNKMVIGWRQFDTVASNFRQAGWAYSHDGGQNWTFPGVLEPGEFSSDPVLEFDAEGNFYYYSLQPGRGPGDWACYLYKSFNRGLSWPQEVYARGGDKAWITIDRTNGVGHGNVYAIWSPFAGCCSGIFTRSTDGGLTFMTPIAVPFSPFWGTVAVGPDGDVYVVGANLAVVKSSNAQDPNAVPSFDLATAIDLGGFPSFGGGPNPGGLLGQVWVASDHSDGPNRGNVYVLSSVQPWAGSDPLDVMFTRSTDGGLTWSPPLRINDDSVGNGAWQWFGTMSVAPQGRLDVIWNDTRNTGAVNLSELYYAFSNDGGLNWSDNAPVSAVFDSYVGWPNQNKIGDYYDMISDNAGAHVAYSATFNGEQDVYYLRLSTDCNGNGIPDHTDIAEGASQDCNENAIPDECELADNDCNTNGQPDDCEDCNGNGLADECDLAAGTSGD